MVTPVVIGGKVVGEGHPAFIIAEAGVNHDGDPAIALQLVDAAAAAGADAVKFQSFSADEIAVSTAPKAAYQRENTGEGSQHAMLKGLELSEQTLAAIAARCGERNILFLSTPFDLVHAELLHQLRVPCFKVSSGELTNTPFLRGLARYGKPLVLSTGMASFEEVAEAVDAVRQANPAAAVVLLQCVSSYPARPDAVNLRAMGTLRQSFDCAVGYSDHTEGIEVALAASALGAAVIEKHFTISRHRSGPDHRFALEPNELSTLVQAVRKVESALGDGIKRPAAVETDVRSVARRSLVAARDIPAGTVLTMSDIAARRPGTGFPPSRLNELIGRKTARPMISGHVLVEADLEGGLRK